MRRELAVNAVLLVVGLLILFSSMSFGIWWRNSSARTADPASERLELEAQRRVLDACLRRWW